MIHQYRLPAACLLLCLVAAAGAEEARRPLVLLSDFGLTERFVASMKGVALSIDPQLQVHDLTHQIEPFNIWQASYMLAGTIDYWPKGTVFVSVVDPGVGTDRRSVVAKTSSGHYVVTPDNGSLTLVADSQGIAEVRQIDEGVNRRPGSEDSHTFHGRDVYSYTGARLAAAIIDFEAVGPLLESDIVRLSYQKPKDGFSTRGALRSFIRLCRSRPAFALPGFIAVDRVSCQQRRFCAAVRHRRGSRMDDTPYQSGSGAMISCGLPINSA